MQRRPGFTITEMLVSVALVMFIMAILSEAFVAGLTTFRDLKAVGDMDLKIRAAAAILRRDLQAYHVSDGNGPTKIRDLAAPPAEGFFVVHQAQPSEQEGLDADGVPSSCSPGMGQVPTHSNNILHFTSNLTQSTDLNAKIKRRDNYFSASLNPADPLSYFPADPLYQALGMRSAYFPPAGTPPATLNYLSQFAEIAYFVRQWPPAPATADMTTGNPLGVAAVQPSTLFNLYRRQVVVLANGDAAFMNAPPAPYSRALKANWGSFYYDLCCLEDKTAPGYLKFPTMAELSKTYYDTAKDPSLVFRSFYETVAPNGDDSGVAVLSNKYPRLNDHGEDFRLVGADLLLTDVISFNIRIMKTRNPADTRNFDFFDVEDTRGVLPLLPPPTTYPRNTYDTGYDNSPLTGPATPPPAETRIGISTGDVLKAVEITLRVWDRKTQKTRQVTVIQDL